MLFFRTYDYDATGIRVSALHQVDTDANGSWDETTNTEEEKGTGVFFGFPEPKDRVFFSKVYFP